MNCIELRDLGFGWPAHAECLHIQSLDVAQGERIFLHGASGSGKSTLLGLLAGVLAPRSGKVCVLDHDLGKLSASGRDRFRVEHIGMIFQQFNLIPYLSVLDNVLLPCRFSATRERRCGDVGPLATAQRLLEHLDIDAALYRRPASALSVGQQQRVAAARALIGNPELIIADEPTSALDAARQETFLTLLQNECAANRAALVFVSHDIRLASNFDRVIELAAINSAELTA